MGKRLWRFITDPCGIVFFLLGAGLAIGVGSIAVDDMVYAAVTGFMIGFTWAVWTMRLTWWTAQRARSRVNVSHESGLALVPFALVFTKVHGHWHVSANHDRDAITAVEVVKHLRGVADTMEKAHRASVSGLN